MKVLSVDDNPLNLKVARKMLEKAGYEVEVVLSGQEALEKIEGEDFNLILIDIRMPGMDGYECTSKIREKGGRFVELPIVALTAEPEQSARKKCMDVGMNDFVGKPFKAKTLIDVISKWAP